MNYDLKNFEDAKKKARKLNREIVLPAPNELQIDIDSYEQYEIYRQRIKELNQIHCVKKTKEIPSPGGADHRHIYISLEDEVSKEERVFLQLFLGSDPIREYLSFCLIKIGDPCPVLFFEDENNTGGHKDD